MPVARAPGVLRSIGAVLAAAVSVSCTTAPVPSMPVPLRLILVGDSTMATRTGYGDALCQRWRGEGPATCLNLARGGRSSGSYRAEGLWDAVLDTLRDGSAGPTLVLIQFGHNDQPGKPGRSTDLAVEFPANLQRYVQETRALGAWPVLVTPLVRRQFDTQGQLRNDLEPWAEAVRAVARSERTPLIDLNRVSAAEVQAIGPTKADELAEAPPGQPRFDRTHLGAKGACLFSRMVEQELRDVVPPTEKRFGRPAGPCAE